MTITMGGSATVAFSWTLWKRDSQRRLIVTAFVSTTKAVFGAPGRSVLVRAFCTMSPNQHQLGRVTHCALHPRRRCRFPDSVSDRIEHHLLLLRR